MAEIKHTAGPFEVQDPMGSDMGFWIVQAGLEAYEWSCIAIVCRDEDRSGKHFITKAEQKANANLFAASPDMLEALKHAHRFIRNGIEFGFIRMPDVGTPDAAHQTPLLVAAAIAKAEGRS